MDTANGDSTTCLEMSSATQAVHYKFSGKSFKATAGHQEIEDVRPLKKRRIVGEEPFDSVKLFLKALRFQQDLVDFCGKILTEVVAEMLDIDNKGREIQIFLNSRDDSKVDLPVKKRSTSQELSGWLHSSKREELYKLSEKLSRNITDCNVKLENLQSSVASLNQNMSFLKTFFDMADNQEKTEVELDDFQNLKGRKDVTYLPWKTPHREDALVNEAVAGILAELSDKMQKIDSDLSKLRARTETVDIEVRSTMSVIKRSIGGNHNTDVHRQISSTMPLEVECPVHSQAECQSSDDMGKLIVKQPCKSASHIQRNFLHIGDKEVTITIHRKSKETQQQGEPTNSSAHSSEESKPIIITREVYDKIKRNSATSFARKLLPYFFNRNELETCNYNTLQERGKEKLSTLQEIVEIEFTGSTVGADAMKKIRDGINASCRAYKEKSKSSNPR